LAYIERTPSGRGFAMDRFPLLQLMTQKYHPDIFTLLLT
jgi:hypothetical protein